MPPKEHLREGRAEICRLDMSSTRSRSHRVFERSCPGQEQQAYSRPDAELAAVSD